MPQESRVISHIEYSSEHIQLKGTAHELHNLHKILIMLKHREIKYTVTNDSYLNANFSSYYTVM